MKSIFKVGSPVAIYFIGDVQAGVSGKVLEAHDDFVWVNHRGPNTKHAVEVCVNYSNIAYVKTDR